MRPVDGRISLRNSAILDFKRARSISIHESMLGLFHKGAWYTPPMTAIVEFRDVTYAINGRPILDNVSFSIARGESVVFLGRSGSGKTTTLKLINRLIEPSSGTISVEEKSVMDWDPIQLRRRIGYVIQEVGLFPHFSVERNVGLVPS